MTVLSGHHRLENRYRFTGRLELTSPLRLSSGRASDVTDAPLMRNRAGVPYIPGSSLRGVLRSELERILAALGPSAGVRSCVLFSEETGEDACITVHRGKQDELKELSDADALAYLDGHLCDLCRLFGSPVYASHLVIEDACPETPENLTAQFNIRDGVGIDRDTGTARENVKFNYEVMEKGQGTFFTFRMQVENLGVDGKHDHKLLALIIALLKEGLSVGGKRSGGLGQVRLRKESIEVRGFKSAQDLWAALQAGKDPHLVLPLTEVLNAEAPAV
jgi:CRISPR-associated protein Csm3